MQIKLPKHARHTDFSKHYSSIVKVTIIFVLMFAAFGNQLRNAAGKKKINAEITRKDL